MPNIPMKEREAMLSTEWAVGDLYDNTLAKIIISNAYGATHRELKGTYNCGSYYLSKGSQKKTWPVEILALGLPKQCFQIHHLTRDCRNTTWIPRDLQRKKLSSHHLDMGFSNQCFTEICRIHGPQKRESMNQIVLGEIPGARKLDRFL